eukprot:TRINITY_DN200_c0_g3_i2.p1 TRINITY_DN200_c0_g3~~TRINITY_DN200_c0_g3_i2.p1  ORF type:complete len:788 (-),score=110.00 TRINITY_DN200_c0_g3_i2:179-2374(-)
MDVVGVTGNSKLESLLSELQTEASRSSSSSSSNKSLGANQPASSSSNESLGGSTGWTRNLIAEGIEPNPGPRTLKELIEKLKKCYDSTVHPKLDRLLVQLIQVLGAEADEEDVKNWIMTGGIENMNSKFSKLLARLRDEVLGANQPAASGSSSSSSSNEALGAGSIALPCCTDVEARLKKMEISMMLLKRELDATKVTSGSPITLGNEMLSLVTRTIKSDQLFAKVEMETLSTLWLKWKEEATNLPKPTEGEVKNFQPILSNLTTLLAQGTAYKIFSNRALGKGDYRPDISITSAREDYLHFKFLISTIELKTTIKDTTLRTQALGQCRLYLSKAALAQPSRNVFIGAITDLCTIQFLRMRRSDDESVFKFDLSEPEALLPEQKGDYGSNLTPGFSSLARLFRTPKSREGLGFHDELRESVMLKQQEIRLGDRLGEGATATVYKAYWKDKEVAVKIANSDGMVTHLAHEAKVLNVFKGLSVDHKVPHLCDFDSSAGVIIMTPVGQSLMRFAEEQYEEDSLHSDFLSIAQRLVVDLEVIHSSGYLHLDIRPTNIVVLEPVKYGTLKDWKDAVLLIDWGLAHRIGSKVSTVFGVPAYQASAWLTAALHQQAHTLSIYDDLESVAYCLLDMFTGLPWLKEGHRYARILALRVSPDPRQILQIMDYLDCLAEMRAKGEVDYAGLGRVLLAGKAALNTPSSPCVLPGRCTGMTKGGVRCQLSTTKGQKLCFQHLKK